MSSRRNRKTFNPGKTLGNYSVMRLIGQGGYGDIYECIDLTNHLFYAMKVESTSCKKQGLKREIEVIRHLRSKYFPQFICYSETSKYRFLIMELFGPSFSALRKHLWDHRFQISTVLRMGIEMLKCIEKMHSLGYIHRDIKPSNFLLRASRRHPIALIDYGLSRPYIDPDTHLPVKQRSNPGFVGTTKYASINAHEGKELGRVDDLFSWFYSLIEMWAGRLPWPSTNDKEEVFNAKLSADVPQFIRGMPKQMTNIYRLISRLGHDEKPNYPLMYSFMLDAMREINATWDDPYEWERYDISEISSISLTPPPNDRPRIPENLPPPEMPPIDIQSILPDKNQRNDKNKNGYRSTLLSPISSNSTVSTSTISTSTISTSTVSSTVSSGTASSSGRQKRYYGSAYRYRPT